MLDRVMPRSLLRHPRRASSVLVFGGLIALLSAGFLVGCAAPARDSGTSAAGMSASGTTSSAAASSAPAAVPSDSAVASAVPAPVVPPPTPVHLAFVGDIALNYSIARDLEKIAAGESPPAGVDAGFPFGGVAERLRAADIAVGNLECVLSTKGDVDTWHKPFRGPVSGIDTVLGAGIDIVSVANNHSWDYGEQGFSDMLRRLDEKKLDVVGRGYRQKLPHLPERAVVRDVRGTRVGFLGFYLEEDSSIARDVAAARKEADLVVVYFHWGKEKQSDATPQQRRQARVAIDAGADVVVGSHVHVLQPTEMYKGKLVAYGLGNFVFMGMNTEERFRRGAILEVEITRDRLVSFEMVPTRVDDRGAPRIVVPESSYLPGNDRGKDKGEKEK